MKNYWHFVALLFLSQVAGVKVIASLSTRILSVFSIQSANDSRLILKAI
jgi:hypothetical protein